MTARGYGRVACALLVLALLLAGTAACSEQTQEPTDDGTQTVRTTRAVPSSGPTPFPGGAGTRTVPAGRPPEPVRRPTAPVCEVEAPATWQRALEQGLVAPPDGEQAAVHLVAQDGYRLVRYGPDSWRSELVWQDPAGAEVTVQQLGETDWRASVTGASFDGRNLAWTLSLWEGTEDETSQLFVWDSVQGGRARQVGRGHLVGAPVVADGVLAWVEAGADPLELGGLHTYDLAADTGAVAAAGYLGPPAEIGGNVVVADQPPEGTTGTSRLVSVSLGDGVPGELPIAVDPAAGVGWLSGHEDVLAWSDRRLAGLNVWQAGDTAVWLPEVAEGEGASVERVAVAREVVAWTGSVQGTPGVFALDLRSGSYARLVTGAGAVSAFGSVLVVGWAAQDAPPRQAVVETAALERLPTCTDGG